MRGAKTSDQGPETRGSQTHKPPQREYSLGCETLEGRALLAASIALIPTVTVPATLGYQVPVSPVSGSTTPANQTYKVVASSNPDIKATVAQGQFVTFNISHTAASGNMNDMTFSGAITFQLFNDLTPLTATNIENFVTQGFYNGKQLFRIASGFPGTNDFIIQGGSSNNTATGTSGKLGTPFIDEFNPQLAFTGNYQLAMANSGPNTNDTQFFITDSLSNPPAGPRALDFKHTIYGQLVSGQTIVDDMTKVATGGTDGTTPVSPVTIVTATVSNVNPNGVIHIDATSALPGETSTVTVTATDPASNTTAAQTFQVSVSGNTGAVRQISNVLVVTPLPRTDGGTNTIVITQVNDTIQVAVNGVIDSLQPSRSSLDRIIVYGSKANDNITIDPSVTVPAVTLDGGHGGRNRLQAGSTPTREHGWFGFNTLIGGTDSNELVGRAGHVKFQPTSTTDEIFAGVPHPRTHGGHPRPPGGTFFKFVNCHLVPISTPKPGQQAISRGDPPQPLPRTHPPRTKKQ